MAIAFFQVRLQSLEQWIDVAAVSLQKTGDVALIDRHTVKQSLPVKGRFGTGGIYTIGGHTYASSRWMAGDEHFSGQGAEPESFLKQFKEETTIYYDPLWPANAVLRPGTTNVTRMLLVVGPWFIFLAIVLLRRRPLTSQ